MKNFRKVLALVLVVATLFSFTAMASAKTYTDADKISYKEAVDVLSYVGILNGYEDDSFKPTQTITREEMAKMIAVLSNAGTDVSTLYASACTFADVAKDRWSASYVAYCAKTGVVAGRSASTFDPTAKVTGLETAKMLLVVLGFNAEKQGYVGADWKVNVLRDAKVMGLLEDFDAKYDVEAAITREEAAQMMLNALEAPCVVGFLSNNSVTITNALVFGGVSLLPNKGELADLFDIATYAKLKDALKAGKWSLYGNVIISDDLLAEKLFGLKKTAAADNDCYMRPGSYWTWTDAKGNVKTITGTTLKPVWSSYNTTVAEIEKVYKSYNLNNYNVTYYRNGKNGVLATDPSAAGKGSLVEIYEIPAATGKSELRIVEIETFIDRITEVDTYHKTVTIGGYTDTNNFGLKTTDVGKVALYWVCGGNASDLHAVELATPKTLKVTKAVKDNTSNKGLLVNCCFYAGSDKYEYADTFNTTINFDVKILGEENGYGVGKEWDVYFDKYGFVMGYKPAGSTEYAYAVVDNDSLKEYYEYMSQSGTKVYSYTGALINFEKNPAVGETIAFDSSVWHNVDAIQDGHDALIRYYVDGQKEIAVEVPGWNDNRAETAAQADLSPYGVSTVDGKYVTEDTEILVRVLNPMTGKHEYKYFAGVDELDVTYVLEYSQYYFKGTKLTYLYAEASYAKTSATAYVLDDRTSEVYLTDGNKVVGYNTYKAIVNGEEAVIATKFPIDKDTNGYYKVYDMNAYCIGLTTDGGDPVYVLPTASEALHVSDGIKVNTVDVSGNVMTINGKAVRLDSQAKFVLVFADGWGDLDFKVVTAADLSEYITNWDHAYVWTSDVDGDLDADLIYINAVDGVLSHGAHSSLIGH